MAVLFIFCLSHFRKERTQPVWFNTKQTASNTVHYFMNTKNSGEEYRSEFFRTYYLNKDFHSVFDTVSRIFHWAQNIHRIFLPLCFGLYVNMALPPFAIKPNELLWSNQNIISYAESSLAVSLRRKLSFLWNDHTAFLNLTEHHIFIIHFKFIIFFYVSLSRAISMFFEVRDYNILNIPYSINKVVLNWADT